MRFAISKTRLPVTALLLALCARPAAAQQGEVTGRVTDKTSGTALATAQVSVVGTTIRALTGQDGRYRLVNVPAGPATLRVAYIGYATTTQEVSVPAGGSAQADFAIAQAAVGLEAIVVTATGDQAVREQGTAAHTVDLRDRTSQAAVSNLSDALNSTVPGVVVQGSGGTTGTGTRVRIRGSNSVSLSNDPVLIVDGIRVENASNSTSIGVGGQQPSRLNDLSPQDLEAVQVNSGPASIPSTGTSRSTCWRICSTTCVEHGYPGDRAVHERQAAPAAERQQRVRGIVERLPGRVGQHREQRLRLPVAGAELLHPYVPKHRSLHRQPASELPAAQLARSPRGDRDGFPQPLRREYHLPRDHSGVVQSVRQPGQPQRESVPDLQLDGEFLRDGLVRPDAHAEFYDERRSSLLPLAQPRRARRRADIDVGDEL